VGNSQRYTDALPGVDLAYSAEDDGLKEELVLKRPTDLTTPTTFTYQVRFPPELEARSNPLGGIDFVDDEGNSPLAFTPPVMADSSETAAGFSRAVTLTATATGPGLATLTLSADRAWVTSPLRQGAITIDPSVKRRFAKRSWNPLTQVLEFGNVTQSNGQCCRADGERDGNSLFNAEKHPERLDYERMPRDGLEYTRMGVYPCVYGVDPVSAANPLPKWMAHYDTVFLAAAERGVQMLPQIDQGVVCPGLSPAGNPPDTTAEYKDLQDVSQQLAYRYGPVRLVQGATGPGQFWRDQGCRDPGKPAARCQSPSGGRDAYYLPVRVWQVWNEPNIRGSWGRDAPDPKPTINPEAFRTALFYARDGLHSGDPGARVLAGGVSAVVSPVPDGEDPKELPKRVRFRDKQRGAREFLEAMLTDPPGKPGTATSGNHCAFDAADMHFYDENGSPFGNKKDGSPKGFSTFLEREIRAPLDAKFNRKTKIWVTELGAASKSDRPEQRVRLTNRRKVQRDIGSQEQWLSSALKQAEKFGGGLGLGPIFNYQWQDTPEDDPQGNNYFANVGLWGRGGVDDPLRTKYNRGTNEGRKPAGDEAARYGLYRGVAQKLPVQRCGGYKLSDYLADNGLPAE